MDFTRHTRGGGRPFPTLHVIDEREGEAWRIKFGTLIPPAQVVPVVNQRLDIADKPAAIRPDSGPELTTEVFVGWAEEHGVRPEMHQTKTGNQWHFGMKAYKGLAKNQGQLRALFGLANLVIAKRSLMGLHARGAS